MSCFEIASCWIRGFVVWQVNVLPFVILCFQLRRRSTSLRQKRPVSDTLGAVGCHSRHVPEFQWVVRSLFQIEKRWSELFALGGHPFTVLNDLVQSQTDCWPLQCYYWWNVLNRIHVFAGISDKLMATFKLHFAALNDFWYLTKPFHLLMFYLEFLQVFDYLY